MKYLKHDLGYRSAGDIVVVKMSGNAANVRLLDQMNFHQFECGSEHSYTGGHFKRSPVILRIPRDGHWHAVVDHGGYVGSTRVSVKVLPIRRKQTAAL